MPYKALKCLIRPFSRTILVQACGRIRPLKADGHLGGRSLPPPGVLFEDGTGRSTSCARKTLPGMEASVSAFRSTSILASSTTPGWLRAQAQEGGRLEVEKIACHVTVRGEKAEEILE